MSKAEPVATAPIITCRRVRFARSLSDCSDNGKDTLLRDEHSKTVYAELQHRR
jgi:hypothetical protein